MHNYIVLPISPSVKATATSSVNLYSQLLATPASYIASGKHFIDKLAICLLVGNNIS